MRRSTILMICAAISVVAVGIGLLVGFLVGPRTEAVAYETTVPTARGSTAVPAQPTATPVLADTPSVSTESPTAASPLVAPSPTMNTVDTAAPTWTPSALSEPSAVVTETAIAQVTPTPAIAYIEYTVQKGDILYTIAIKYHVTIEDILAINQIPNPSSLNVGQVIRIPKK
jgi:LysM repeat protein